MTNKEEVDALFRDVKTYNKYNNTFQDILKLINSSDYQDIFTNTTWIKPYFGQYTKGTAELKLKFVKSLGDRLQIKHNLDALYEESLVNPGNQPKKISIKVKHDDDNSSVCSEMTNPMEDMTTIGNDIIAHLHVIEHRVNSLMQVNTLLWDAVPDEKKEAIRKEYYALLQGQ